MPVPQLLLPKDAFVGRLQPVPPHHSLTITSTVAPWQAGNRVWKAAVVVPKWVL